MSKKCQRNGISVSLKSHTESHSEESQKILFWRVTWMRSPRRPGTKSSTCNSWWKLISEKIRLDWVQHEDPKFGTKNFRICIIPAATRAWISKTTVIESPSMGSSSSTRENTLAQWIGKEEPSSSRKLCKKLPRNWRIKKKLLWGRKSLQTTKIGRISCAAWSGITNSESILLRSWLTEQSWRTYVPHQTLTTSSSRKPSREVGMQWHTRENMHIPGNVFDRQHAQRDPDE